MPENSDRQAFWRCVTADLGTGYRGSMAQNKSFSLAKLVAAVGGGLLVAAFFLPLVDVQAGGEAAAKVIGVEELRREIQSTREIQQVAPLIEPALQELERFAVLPSLRNLAGMAAVVRDLLNTAASLNAPEAQALRNAGLALGMLRYGLWLLPLIGAIQVVVPLLSRLCGPANALFLIVRFAFGWPFFVMALAMIVGVPSEARPFIGTAPWALLAGGGLMIGSSLGGVTRENAWLVLIADAAMVVLTLVVLGSAATLYSQG